jgi:ferredoxin
MSRITFSDFSILIIKNTFKTRFLLAKACKKVPPLAGMVNKLFFEGDDLLVLPRDGTINSSHKIEEIEINKDIDVSQEDTVLPSQILKEMIMNSKYHFIMNSCICRVCSDCNDYPHNLGCLFLGKGSKKISPKLGKPVTPQEAMEHVDKCQKAGLVHIVGRNKLDSFWLNTGPKEDLLTICNCCPCCCLWKMAPDLPENMGKSFAPMIGARIKFNQDLCIGCGKCGDNICFVDAITMENEKAVIDIEKCRCCGRCVEVCSKGVFNMEIDPNSVENSIEHIKKLVDVESE